MNVLKIVWEQTNFRKLPNQEDTYFYAFTRANNLLYIGIAYKQKVKDEIRQRLGDLGVNTHGLSIWLGYIDENRTSYSRITEQIVRDAECLQIHINQPSLNSQCMQNYTGRCNLTVKTSGCSLIRRCQKCENNTIYKTC